MSEVTEQELIEKAKAPRVTEVDLLSNIKEHICFNVFDVLTANGLQPDFQMKTLTMCVIVLQNGFTVTGQSACADPANYNEDLGNRLAFEDAKKKIWAFMGYSLKQEVYLNGDGTFVGRMEREARELGSKLSSLDAFTQTNTFVSLPPEEQALMHQQREAMAEYHQTLIRRIESKKA